MAGVLVAGLLLPYAIGAGVTTNRMTAAIETADTSLIDMSKMPLRSTLVDSEGNTTAIFYEQNREWVPLSAISKSLQYAVTSVEDRRFKLHNGVDWQGTLRALLKNASGEEISGGSTITQQLVKNYLYLVAATTPAEKADAIASTPLRKLREAKIALMYEKTHTKDEILEQYLNLVAFGPNTYGAEAASQHFFGVSAEKLTVSQAALLAAMINNPNKYNPLVGSQVDETLKRRNLVIQRMARDKWITQKAADEAKAVPIAADLNASYLANGCIEAANHATNGYMCRYVLDYLMNAGISYEDISRNGYRIVSTLDPEVMKYAVDAVRDTVNPDDPDAERIANVMAIVEPGAGTRKVLALAANRPYGLDQAKGETVQRLTTTFAPLGAGSVFKIFAVAEGMERGLGANSMIDVPKKYTSPLVETHEFSNSGKFPKEMSVAQALAESPNTPFIALSDQVGVASVAEMAVKLGLRGYELDAGEVDRAFAGIGTTYQQQVSAQKMASFALGVSPVSPLELANVGATLDSDGLWCPPTPVAAISDRTGRPVTWDQIPCEQAVPPELAHTLTNALTNDIRSPRGTAHQAAADAEWTRTAATKTGTTQDYKSSAFLGYTPYYSAAVMTWDYLNRPQPMCQDPLRSCDREEAYSGEGLTGGSIPAATWFAVMNPLHANEPNTPFPVSDPQYLSGLASAQLPNVEGLLLTDGLAKLEAFGFDRVEVEYTTEAAAPANTIVDQDPSNAALPGVLVTLTVSSGSGASSIGHVDGSTTGGDEGWAGGDDGSELEDDDG